MASRDQNYYIELATKCDKQGILDISKSAFFGYDYLPHCLDLWIDQGLGDNPRRWNVVLKEKSTGKVVGYESIYIQNHGQSAVAQGLRIHLDLRSLGLNRTLKTLVSEKFGKELAKMERVGIFNARTIPKKFLNPPSTMKRYFNILETNFEGIRMNFRNQSATPLQDMSFHDLGNMLNSPQHPLSKSTLFDEKYLLIECHPYHICDMKYLASLHHVPLKVLYSQGKSDIPSLSLVSSPFKIPKGMRISIDIFAPDLDSAKLHLSQQLGAMANETKYQKFRGQVALYLLLNEAWGYDLVKYLCQDLNLAFVPKCYQDIGPKATCVMVSYPPVVSNTSKL